MTFLETTFEKITTKKSKSIFLIVLICYLLVICLARYNTWFDNAWFDGISRANDLIQFAVLFASLIYIFLTINREEKKRYFTSPILLMDIYSAELKKFLIIDRSNRKNITFGQIEKGLVNLDNFPRNLSDENLKILNSTIILSSSILEFKPELKDKTISDVIFTKTDNRYELPWYIQERARWILLNRFNLDAKSYSSEATYADDVRGSDYNGSTLSVSKFLPVNDQGKLEFIFKKSNYYNYLVTNLSPELEIMANKTARQMLEPGPSINWLEDSEVENHLGISCLIITSDNFAIIPKRNDKTSVSKKSLSPSVSGAANIDTCSLPDSTLSAWQWLSNELNEELSSRIILNQEKVFFLGVTRELKRLGKPEAFFFTKIDQTWNEVKNILDGRPSETDINKNENEKYLSIPISDIEDILVSGVSHKDFISTCKEEDIVRYYFKTKMGHQISESLLVNIILAKGYF